MFIVKNCRGTPIPDGVHASKPWSISSTCANLRRQHPLCAKIWSSKKVDLGGSKLTCPTLLLVDVTVFAERWRNRCRTDWQFSLVHCAKHTEWIQFSSFPLHCTNDVLFIAGLVAYWPACIHDVALLGLYCPHVTSGRLAVCYSQRRSIFFYF